MSLGVAIQSAVFYVVACTPCTSSRQRNKAKAKAKRERLEKDRLEAENPGLYRQPSPFNTSPHWDEEIMMGPSLPKKSRNNNNNNNTSQRRLTTSSSSGRETAVSSSTLPIGSTSTPTTGMVPTPNTKLVPRNHAPPNPGSSSTVAPNDGGSLSAGGSESWNLKLYQREDEELWGDQSSSINQETTGDVARTGHNKLMDAIVKAGSSAGRLLDSTLLGGSGKERNETREVTNQDRRNFYHSPSSPSRSSSSSHGSYSSPFAPVKNPPVNDYHPPVVSSHPAHRDGRRWMLQPPPPVKVMEAKVPVSRSTSMASTASRRSALLPGGASASDPHLGRVVGERLVGAKIKGGELPFPATAEGKGSAPLILSLPPKTGRPRRATTSSSRSKLSQRSRTSRSISSDSDDADSSDAGRPYLGVSPKKSAHGGRRSNAATQRPAVTPEVESEDDTQGHAAQRPKLETIMSSDRPSPSEEPKSTASATSAVKNEAAQDNKGDDMHARPAGSSIDSGLALSLA